MFIFRFCSKRVLFNFFLCCVSRRRIWVQLLLYQSFIFQKDGAIIYQYKKQPFSFPFSTASSKGIRCWEKRRCWEKEPWILMKVRWRKLWKKSYASQLSCSVIDVALELHNPIEETHYANSLWEVTAKAHYLNFMFLATPNSCVPPLTMSSSGPTWLSQIIC